MALVNPYCTTAQVQAEIRNTAAAILTQLEEAINQASRWIDARLGRDFYQHDYSTTALVLRKWDDVAFGDTIFLPYRPIISLTEVKVLGSVWTASTEYTTSGGRLISLVGDWPICVCPTLPGSYPPWILDLSALPTVEVKGKFGCAQPDKATAGAIQTAGTGYSALAVLTVVGGTGTAATFTVTSVTGGVPQGVTLLTAGSYTVQPTNPVATTCTAGTGCKLTLTLAVDTAAVPTDIPLEITRAAILVAAAFSGCNRKEIVGLDGSKEEVIDNKISPTVDGIIGSRSKIVV